MKYFLGFLLIILFGCTDAMKSEVFSLGKSAQIICYSGGQKIYEEKTTGKVFDLAGGGWAFTTLSGKYVQTFADCFVLVD